MAPTCENNVQIKLTPKNFVQIYQYLGIFVLPETSVIVSFIVPPYEVQGH
jgi:hypothetical protein